MGAFEDRDESVGYRIRKGGAGSGNFGHAGRPGKVGGSAPSGGGGGDSWPAASISHDPKAPFATGKGWDPARFDRYKTDFYWKVQKPFNVMALAGHVPSNAYYGASQIYKPKYEPLTLRKGDQIHYYNAGQYYYAYREGIIYKVASLTKVKGDEDIGAFGHRYGEEPHTSPIPSEEYVKEISPQERERFRYENLNYKPI